MLIAAAFAPKCRPEARITPPLGAAKHEVRAWGLSSTAAEGHALTYHGSVLCGKLACVLLFVRFLLQVPIPARFMLYANPGVPWQTPKRCDSQFGSEHVTDACRGARVSERNTLQGVKVLVIDDSNTIRRSAEIFLLQAGCTVILAEDGFDALAKIADHQPDLVFVDIMMPRLDGYQTCALIKKNARFHDTPVVMLSSKAGLFDRARGRMVGSDQYLTKPFTKESLLKAVATHARAAAA